MTHETNDSEALLPIVEAVGKQCGEKPERARADSGSISSDNLKALEETSIDAYVPDTYLARALNWGGRLRQRALPRTPVHQRMRRKLADPVGRRI